MRKSRWPPLPWACRLYAVAAIVVVHAARVHKECTRAACTTAATAAARDDPDDADERQYQFALGKRTFEEHCLSCHSDEMTTHQRLTSAQWKTEVDKMVGWGAAVPPEQTERLIDYLTTAFAPSIPPASPETMPIDRAATVDQPSEHGALAGRADRGGPLYAAHCATCHGPDGQGDDLGPNLVERPVLRRFADYTRVVREGQRRMPSYRAVLSPLQADEILHWLRTREFTDVNP